MLKKILKIIFCIGVPLFLVACSSSDFSNQFSQLDTVDGIDMSVGYLGQIFGTMPGALTGTGNYLLSDMFKVFNVGILSLLGLFLTYHIFLNSLRSVLDSSPQATSGMVFTGMKIAVAVVLITPFADSGYSISQDLVMKATIAGVDLANKVWIGTLDYLDEGHVIYSTSNTSQGEGILSTDNFAAFMGMGGKSSHGDTFSSPGTGDPTGGSDPLNYLGTYILNAEVCMFDAVSNTSVRASQGTGTNITSWVFPSNCGSINWSLIGGGLYSGTGSTYCDSPDSSSNDAIYCEEVSSAVFSAITDMIPAAQSVYCAQQGSDSTLSACSSFSASNDVASYVENSFVQAYIDYSNQVFFAYDAHQRESEKTDDVVDKIKKQAKTEGWAVAGRYYWLLENLTETATDMSTFSNYTFTADSGGLTTSPAKIENTAGNWYDPSEIGQGISDASGTIGSTMASLNATTSSSSISNKTGNDQLDAIAGFSAGVIDAFSKTGDYANPSLWLFYLGKTCITAAELMWASMLTVIVGMGILAYLDASQGSAGYVLDMMVSWLAPVVILIAGLLLSSGATLVYYVALYPFAVFLIRVIAWFVQVIESVTAVPLIAIGITHPDGKHDVAGNLEQGLMLVLTLFLTPVSMIIGLIAAMVLSFVTFGMLNHTFSMFMHNLYSTTSFNYTSQINISQAVSDAQSSYDSASVMSQMLFMPILVTIFTTIVIEVMHQCFALIYQVPEYITRWIGGEQSNFSSMIERSMGAVKDAGGAAAKGAGDAIGAGVKGAGDAAEAIDYRKRHNPAEETTTATAGKGDADGDIEMQDLNPKD